MRTRVLVAGMAVLLSAATMLAGPAAANGDPGDQDVDTFRADVVTEIRHINNPQRVAAEICVDMATRTMTQEGQAISTSVRMTCAARGLPLLPGLLNKR